APEQVTHVLLSHLHFDHCGWNTRARPGVAPAKAALADLVPTFPNATYWLEAGEVEHARHANERDRASYDPRNWQPLFAAGVVRLLDGGGAGAEPIPGVRATRVPGHNASMCVVEIGGGEAVFLADLVSTAAHVAYPWIMSYDLFPMTTLENKKIWLPRLAAA